MAVMGTPEHVSHLLDALQQLDDAADANTRRAEAIRARIGHLRDQLSRGRSVRDVVAEEDRPLIVELVTENMQTLESRGSAVRRAEAEALRAEGLTQQDVAELFGVTRQRISALLAGSDDRRS